MRNRETKAEREKEREREREREHVTVGEVRQSIRLPGPKEFKLGFAGRVWYASCQAKEDTFHEKLSDLILECETSD